MSTRGIVITPPAEVVAADLDKMAKKILDLTPVWNRSMPVVRGSVEEAFQTKGASIGRAWPALSKAYARRVGRASATLVKSGALRSAATRGALHLIKPLHAKYRISIDYVGYMQFGGKVKRGGGSVFLVSNKFTKKGKRKRGKQLTWREHIGEIPARPFADMTPKTQNVIQKDIEKHVDDAANAFELGSSRASGVL
jgi:phage gpG-like protein